MEVDDEILLLMLDEAEELDAWLLDELTLLDP